MTERTIGPANTNAIGQHVQSVYCAVPLEDPLVVAFLAAGVLSTSSDDDVLHLRPGTIVDAYPPTPCV